MKKVYAIYDSKAEAYMQPFFQDTHGLALRTFEIEVQKGEQSIISKYPADFTLFYIADWDEHKGVITAMTTPNSLGVAIEFAAKTDLQAVN